jgi:hypothetical protein
MSGHRFLRAVWHHRRVNHRWRLCVGALLVAGCGSDASLPTDDDDGSPPQRCPVSHLAAEDGSCCEPGTAIIPGGGCLTAGIAEGACAEGFTWGDGACVPALPAATCPTGEMAIPGQTECRPVAPCQGGPFGATPDEATTVYVDASYTGADSDGSKERPWTQIAQGVTGAAPGAAVGVAPGVYAEDVAIYQPVRLYGRCPGEVIITGAGEYWTLIVLGAAASGAEIHDLTVTGAYGVAMAVADASDVLVQRAHLYDAQVDGMTVSSNGDPTSVVVEDSLVETARATGLFVQAAAATLRRSVVRDVGPDPTGLSFGVYAQPCLPPGCAPAGDASLVVDRSVVEGVGPMGVTVLAASLDLSGSVVRDLRPSTQLDYGGAGVLIDAHETGIPATAALRDSVIERVPGAGVWVAGSAATLTGVTVRDMLADEVRAGWGLIASSGAPDIPADVSIERSALLDTRQAAVFVSDAALQLTSTLVRGVRADPSGVAGALVAQTDDDSGRGSWLVVHDSLVQDVDEIGVFAAGSALELHHVDLDAVSLDGRNGAIWAQRDSSTDLASTLWMESSRARDVRGWGVVLSASTGTIWGSHVADVGTSSDALFGNAVAVFSDQVPASLRLEGSLVERAALSGAVSFGAQLELVDDIFRCNDIAISAVDNFAFEPEVVDLGGNLCECEEPFTCKALEVELEPPKALP